jgi:hypothetical protein
MGLHVLGECRANLVLADAVAREIVAMFTVLRGRARSGPVTHAFGGDCAQMQPAVLVDAAYCSERIRMQLPLIHIIELIGPTGPRSSRPLHRAPPVGALPWSEFVDLLKPAGELINDTFFPDSEQLRAQLYRQLVMNLSLGYFLDFQTDTDHPDWTPFLNSVFMLQPNPDDIYFNAHLSAAGIYRIVGERGTVKLLSARRIGAQLRRRW